MAMHNAGERILHVFMCYGIFFVVFKYLCAKNLVWILELLKAKVKELEVSIVEHLNLFFCLDFVPLL
jgi:hypothetical protein